MQNPSVYISGRLARPCTHKSRLVSSGWSLSALPPKADIRQRIEHVCFVRMELRVTQSHFRDAVHGGRRNDSAERA